MSATAPPARPPFHYAWVALAVTFLVMLVTAGARAAPGVLLVPLQRAFGWDLGTISAALSINLALFGLMGPFAAAAMQQLGLRRTVLAALALLVTAVAASGLMRQTWQLWLLWGLLVGVATGATSMTLGAVVANRWFLERRGFAMGLLTASTATGQLVFLPLLAALGERWGWRAVVWSVAAAGVVVMPLVWLLLPEGPGSKGLRRYGDAGHAPAPAPATGNPIRLAFDALALAARNRDFWLLFATFFICGATTNGYVGTHFISMCGDHGLTPVQGAGVLATMGAFDLVGTSLSGWLSDRFDSRALLFVYYGLRGAALLYLPWAFGFGLLGLPLFALIYGLDWVATVPPTVRLCADAFGPRDAPVVFGWIVAGHQLGASCAALVGGMLRAAGGSYAPATLMAGALGVIAALLALRIRRAAPAAA